MGVASSIRFPPLPAGSGVVVSAGGAEVRIVIIGSMVGSAVEQEAAANNIAKNSRSFVFMVIHLS
jgi:hypothetical protein